MEMKVFETEITGVCKAIVDGRTRTILTIKNKGSGTEASIVWTRKTQKRQHKQSSGRSEIENSTSGGAKC